MRRDYDVETYATMSVVSIPPQHDYNYALEWDLVNNEAVGIIPDHHRHEFLDRDTFEDYLGTLQQAERVGMCTNIRTWHRTVTVGPWQEGLHE